MSLISNTALGHAIVKIIESDESVIVDAQFNDARLFTHPLCPLGDCYFRHNNPVTLLLWPSQNQ